MSQKSVIVGLGQEFTSSDVSEFSAAAVDPYLFQRLGGGGLLSANIPFKESVRFLDGSIGLNIHEDDLKRLVTAGVIEKARENIAFDIPHDPEIGPAASVDEGDNWGSILLGAEWFADNGFDGKGVRVGILDSGIDLSHPDFSSSSLAAFSSFSSDGITSDIDPNDSQWHGTHVAGVIAGKGTAGARGLAPNCSLFVGQCIHGWKATVASIKAGLDWALQQELDILNLSLGWPGLHDDWVPEIRRLLDAGVIICASSGNEYGTANETRSPGNYAMDGILSVGAVNSSRDIWLRSGGGKIQWPDESELAGIEVNVPYIVAPGVNILSASAGGGFRNETGTSMACPHLTGLLACLLSHNSIGSSQALQYLNQSLVDSGTPGQDVRFGNGHIDFNILKSILLTDVL